MSDFAFRLLNDFQRDFPLVPAPFHAIADRLGARVEDVLDTLRHLNRAGVVSRVGAVFRPNRVGVSTLAALSVPEARLAEVAERISAHPEVNHNYEREHRFNLWFVATARDATALDRLMARIRAEAGSEPLRLPLEREYHIDLGFDLRGRVAHGATPSPAEAAPPLRLDAADYALIAAIQDGLPLVPHPYAQVAARLGMDETEVLARLERLFSLGAIKRFGVVVRHHELGFQANAMVVWDIPDPQVDALGSRIGASGLVNLCYRRPRRLPEWPYNLFCMIHGRDRAAVLERLSQLQARCSLGGYPHAVLFSRRRFKQTGARYVPDAPVRAA